METVEPVADVDESAAPMLHDSMGGMPPSSSSNRNDPMADGVRQPLSPNVGQFINEFFVLAADIERSLIASGERHCLDRIVNTHTLLCWLTDVYDTLGSGAMRPSRAQVDMSGSSGSPGVAVQAGPLAYWWRLFGGLPSSGGSRGDGALNRQKSQEIFSKFACGPSHDV